MTSRRSPHEGPAYRVERVAVNGARYEGESFIHLERLIEDHGKEAVLATLYSYQLAKDLLFQLKTAIDLYESMRPDEPI